MRKDLDQILTLIGKDDPSLMVVVSDLGSFRVFRAAYPERFINVGVAEQNSAGIAAGLASEGKRVILFGVAGFTLYRAFEQIKYSIGYWNQRVCVIGTGFGWNFYQIGRGHHAADDLALMRLVPNMQIFTPADAASLHWMLAKAQTGPSYIRLGLGIESNARVNLPKYGKDMVILALGEMSKRACGVINGIREEGVDVGLLGVEEFSIEAIRKMLGNVKEGTKLFVLEDHVKLGGLGSMVDEAGYRINGHMHLPINVEHVSASEEKLLECYGFSEGMIRREIITCLKR